MKPVIKKLIFISLISATSILFSCNNDTTNTTDTTDTTDTTETGYFIDGPVKGLKYTTSSGITGTTDINGAFKFEQGDTIKFMISSLQLGIEVECTDVITPLELCEATDLETSTKATNMVRFLMSFDNGDNPYGLTLPDDIHTKFDTTQSASIGDILEMDENDFKAAISEIYKDVNNIDLDPDDIPDASEAANHFKISSELIDNIEYADVNDKENLFLTVMVPNHDQETIQINYNLEEVPEGVTSYNSGRDGYIDDEIVSFREKMLPGNWILTLMYNQKDTRISVDDILSFYSKEGFVSTLPTEYTLEISENAKTVLQANLTTDGSYIKTVHNVSGTITVPQFLPDGSTDIQTIKNSFCFTLFVNIIDSSSEKNIASFSVMPVLDENWETDGDNYTIGYETDLPDGLNLSTQIYLSIEDTNSTTYDTISFNSLGTLTEAVSNINYVSSDWELNEYRGLSRGLSRKNVVKFDTTKGTYSY